VDLFGQDIADTGVDLLEAMIHTCRQEKLTSIHASCSEDSELVPVLSAVGFRRRECSSRVVAYAGSEQRSKQLLSGQRWPFGKVEVML